MATGTALRALLMAGSLVLALASAALGQTKPHGLPADLVGTTWRWVGFDSATEKLAVDAPERYTVAFGTDDRIAIRADCNRGSGPASSPSAGALRIGAVAITLMGCPPGSLGDRFARDVSRAVRYAIRDGALDLELPDGSGTLRLRRAP